MLVVDQRVRLLYLTDLHFKSNPHSLGEATYVVECEDPDVLLLGGDFEDAVLLKKFLRSCRVPDRRRAFFILGNKDLFRLTGDVPAVHLDDVVYQRLGLGDYALLLVGFSGCIAPTLRSQKAAERCLTLAEFERRVLYKAEALRLEKRRFLVVLMHEPTLEILHYLHACGLTKIRYNPRLSSRVSELLKLLGPDVVLTGHLHVETFACVQRQVSGRTALHILATWTPDKYYVTLDLYSSEVQIQIRRECTPVYTQVLKTAVCVV